MRGVAALRRIAIVLATFGCIGLGAVQFASMAAFGDLAHPPAVPQLLSARFGLALARRFGGAVAAPAVLRTAYAQALLHRGDSAAAALIVAQLPDGIDAAELRGQLAELRGQPTAALQAYARAGDFEGAQRLIDARVVAGQLAPAAQLERQLASALPGSGQAAVQARAFWRLGQITQLQSVADPVRRTAFARAALQWYDRALEIAPNEETYLLAAGQQALTVGDKELAARYYVRALDAVPASADALAGLKRARS